MARLRLVAWNGHHGSLTDRLARLAPFSPDIVFLQECLPTTSLLLGGVFIERRINARKSIALAVVNEDYAVTEVPARANAGKAVTAANITGPVALNMLGIWSQGPHYVDDVVRSLDAYDDILRSGRTVVMGDLNSGPNAARREVSRGHQRLLDAFEERGLVSAYHVFHGVEHGREAHHTYRHRFSTADPWHLDFCFVPKAWAANVVNVKLIDGDEWRAASDHHPLVVDLQLE